MKSGTPCRVATTSSLYKQFIAVVVTISLILVTPGLGMNQVMAQLIKEGRQEAALPRLGRRAARAVISAPKLEIPLNAAGAGVLSEANRGPELRVTTELPPDDLRDAFASAASNGAAIVAAPKPPHGNGTTHAGNGTASELNGNGSGSFVAPVGPGPVALLVAGAREAETVLGRPGNGLAAEDAADVGQFFDTKPLAIAHVIVEFAGLLSGGVGQGVGLVGGPLATKQVTRGHKVAAFLPYYPKLIASGITPQVIRESLPMTLPNGRTETFGLLKATVGGVDAYLINHPGIFTGHEFYDYFIGEGHDVFDRAIFLAAAAQKAIEHVLGRPDVVHFHDWPGAAGPFIFGGKVPTVLTIHNAAHKAPFTVDQAIQAGLDLSLFPSLLTNGNPNLLRLGALATKLTTVSPTYREETLGREGRGNEDILSARRDDYSGILNGVDVNKWDPGTDPRLAKNYGVGDATAGKAANKLALQRKQGLAVDPRAPLIVAVARLSEQKGLDFLEQNLDSLIASGAQVVIMGNVADGDVHGETLARKFEARQAKSPQRFAFVPFNDDELPEILLDAAADIFYMGSRFEPGGIADQHAMRLGAVVVGAPVGGINDKIVDFDENRGSSNGFLASEPSTLAIFVGLQRAFEVYRHSPTEWKRLVANAMSRDASWDEPADAYDKVYRAAIEAHKAGRSPSQQLLSHAHAVVPHAVAKDQDEIWGLPAYPEDGPDRQYYRIQAQQIYAGGVESLTGEKLQSFYFRPQGGEPKRASNEGLDGFLGTKLDLERQYGLNALLDDLPYCFMYLRALFSPFPWAAPILRKIDEIGRLGQKTLEEKQEKNRQLNEYLAGVRQKISDELDSSMPGRHINLSALLPRPADVPTRLSELMIDPPSGAEYFESPDHWGPIYSLATDRGNLHRNAPALKGAGLADGREWHGGTFRGIIEKLDYLEKLGVQAVHLTPFFRGLAYHGYWVTDFLSVDPHLGSEEDLQLLISLLHERGIRFIMDLVVSHTGPVLERYGKFDGRRKKNAKFALPVYPLDFMEDPEYFAMMGEMVSAWHNATEKEMLLADIPGGLNRTNTDSRKTLAAFIKIASYWAMRLDVDGMRIDSGSHLPEWFKEGLTAGIQDFVVKKLGKENFLFLVEMFDGCPEKLAAWLRKDRRNAVYNYPWYFWLAAREKGLVGPDGIKLGALHGGPTNSIQKALEILRMDGGLGPLVDRAVTFLGNLDKPEYLEDGESAERQRFGMFTMLTSPGIPLIPFGQEQAFHRVNAQDWLGLDAYRHDLWSTGQFRHPADSPEGFNAKSDAFQWTSALIRAREANPALSRGSNQDFMYSENGPGLLAYIRTFGEAAALAVGNNASENRSATIRLTGPLARHRRLVDTLDPAYSVPVIDGHVAVTVPKDGGRILVPGQ